MSDFQFASDVGRDAFSLELVTTRAVLAEVSRLDTARKLLCTLFEAATTTGQLAELIGRALSELPAFEDGTCIPNAAPLFWWQEGVNADETGPVVDVLSAVETSEAACCPCCRFWTLGERGAFELCSVCFWEDDGQDDHDADVVRGGPNGSLSLAAARQNFAAFGACEAGHRENVRAPSLEERLWTVGRAGSEQSGRGEFMSASGRVRRVVGVE